MKITKILAVILVIAMIAAFAVSCGGGNNETSTTTTTAAKQETPTTTTTTTTKKETPVGNPGKDYTVPVEIYYNDFDQDGEFVSETLRMGGAQCNLEKRAEGKGRFGKIDPNHLTSIVCISNSWWKEEITLNNNNGAISIKTMIYTHGGYSQDLIVLNGVTVLSTDENGAVCVGGEDMGVTAYEKFRNFEVFITIKNVATGKVEVSVTNYSDSGVTEDWVYGDVTIGEVYDVLEISGSAGDAQEDVSANKFHVGYLKVEQNTKPE